MRFTMTFAVALAGCSQVAPGTTGGTTGGQLVCQSSTAAAMLWSGECTPSQTTTFCLFTENQDF